jgi:hypothetical protein
MICAKCSYAWNPDSATSCVQCKAPLESALPPRRGDTLDEDQKPEPVRHPTVAEGMPVIPRAPEPEVSQPRWNDSLTPERAERRRTVFAGMAPVETPAQVSPSGQRRPQTISVDPSRKIVGVLITYSWQDQGQVFPVLEGRNLIGKDPNQCDICVPQDQTLSAVNTFITYRRHFIIGDKVSMSGTDVNGEPIETEFVPLHNYAKIRTGSTYWTFVAIQPPTDPLANS